MIGPTVAASCVILAACGVALVLAGLRPVADHAPEPAWRRRGPVRYVAGAGLSPGARRRRHLLLGVSGAAGLTLWAVTGWAVAALVLPAAALVLPALLSPPVSRTDMAELAALEQWVRGLSGVLVAGAGIEQAVHASLASTPPAILEPVQRLAARLRAQVPTEPALRAFADDLDDATGDLVAAALILGVRRREGGLAGVLEDFATSVAEEVRMRRAVEADRAKPRNTARWVTVISLIVVTALFLLTDYMEPYRDGVGQVVLVGLLAAYVATLAWLRRLSTGEATPRFLGAGGAP